MALKTGTHARTRFRSLQALGCAHDDLKKEVIPMLIDIAMFVLSALGLLAAGQQFIQRGRNLGLWG